MNMQGSKQSRILPHLGIEIIDTRENRSKHGDRAVNQDEWTLTIPIILIGVLLKNLSIESPFVRCKGGQK